MTPRRSSRRCWSRIRSRCPWRWWGNARTNRTVFAFSYRGLTRLLLTRGDVTAMTTQAPPRPSPSPLPSFEDATAPLETGAEELILEALPLLDHRNRKRLVSQGLAQRGPHLAFEDGKQTLLYPLDANIV